MAALSTRVDTIPIWENKVMKISSLEGTKSEVSNRSIRWDASRTNLVTATLNLVARPKVRSRFALKIVIGNENVMEESWDLFDSEIKRTSVGVTSILKNGTNTFTAIFDKFFGNFSNVEVIFTLTLTLELESKDPTKSPPPPNFGPSTGSLPVDIPTIISLVGVGLGTTTLIIAATRRKKS